MNITIGTFNVVVCFLCTVVFFIALYAGSTGWAITLGILAVLNGLCAYWNLGD